LFQDHSDNGEENNDEVENVPGVFEVRVFNEIEAHDYDFENAFDYEAPRDYDEQQLKRVFLKWILQTWSINC
jgi:hypothetical protein